VADGVRQYVILGAGLVLRKPSTDANPAAETKQNLAGHLGPEPLEERRPLLARQRQGELVIEDSWHRLLEMKSPGDGRHHRRPARTPERRRHRKQC
jgi:hypothetical protein